MKAIKKLYKKSLLAVALVAGSLLSSCTDYLTIIPSDQIVHEDFWQTEDQVNGMLAHSYTSLISTAAMERAIVWGELRADNMTFRESAGADLKYLVEANILDDNSYSNWAVFYEAINYANLVIEYAPLVTERDPDFTEGDLQVVVGEMYAMRALCHFYLVRAFRDIPMALVPAVNDADLPDYHQVHPLEALNYIMEDLERAEGMVMKSGGYTTQTHNFGRITENAVLAIKADVNLWRAAFAQYYEGTSDLVAAGDIQRYYDECVADCRTLLANMNREYEEDLENSSVAVIRYPYDLIQNGGTLKDKKDNHFSTAYDMIFGIQNSVESIFELQVEGTNTDGECRAILNLYGTEKDQGKLVVPTNFLSKLYQDDDLRAYTYTNAKSLKGGADANTGGNSNDTHTRIVKYSAQASPALSYRDANDFDANWIVYRKTDVLLMMAEAMVNRPSASTEDFTESFNIVKAINTRSRVDSTNIKRPLDLNSYMTQQAAAQLVLDERARELSYEGKRWFDLVRVALRDGSTSSITFVADKLDSNSGVVKSKMATIDGLFLPIFIEEMRFNKNLVQNPAYIRDDESVEMN